MGWRTDFAQSIGNTLFGALGLVVMGVLLSPLGPPPARAPAAPSHLAERLEAARPRPVQASAPARAPMIAPPVAVAAASPPETRLPPVIASALGPVPTMASPARICMPGQDIPRRPRLDLRYRPPQPASAQDIPPPAPPPQERRAGLGELLAQAVW